MVKTSFILPVLSGHLSSRFPYMVKTSFILPALSDHLSFEFKTMSPFVRRGDIIKLVLTMQGNLEDKWSHNTGKIKLVLTM
jgi:hypothetical protein